MLYILALSSSLVGSSRFAMLVWRVRKSSWENEDSALVMADKSEAGNLSSHGGFLIENNFRRFNTASKLVQFHTYKCQTIVTTNLKIQQKNPLNPNPNI